LRCVRSLPLTQKLVLLRDKLPDCAYSYNECCRRGQTYTRRNNEIFTARGRPAFTLATSRAVSAAAVRRNSGTAGQSVHDTRLGKLIKRRLVRSHKRGAHLPANRRRSYALPCTSVRVCMPRFSSLSLFLSLCEFDFMPCHHSAEFRHALLIYLVSLLKNAFTSSKAVYDVMCV